MLETARCAVKKKSRIAPLQGLTLASDIGHLTDKICKCPIDVSYKQTNVLLICYKGGHCPIISSTRTSRPAFFFFFFFFFLERPKPL